jgi:hypothetical protein
MVGVVVVWLCQCGARIKVIAEACENGSRETQVSSCPRCGKLREIHAARVVSVAEDRPALTSDLPRTNAGLSTLF